MSSKDTKKDLREEKKKVLLERTAKAREHRNSLVNELAQKGESQKAMLIDARTLNSFILELFYEDDENTEFHTFREWLSMGYSVIKGSKGFPLWGRPLREQTEEQGKDPGDLDEQTARFFPLSYVFSNVQVQKLES